MASLNDLNASGVTELANWIPEIWSRLVYEEAINKMMWEKYSGPEGSGMPIIIKRDILDGPGDTIHISQLANLSAAGVTGENTLQGQEEKLSTREITVSPEWYRHAVAETKKAKVQINQEFREKARSVLGKWMATKMDDSMWTAASRTGLVGFRVAAIRQIFANDATSTDTIDSSDTFGVEEIRKAVNYLESLNIEKVGGENGYFVMLIHTHQKYRLIKDSEWIAAQRDAALRGEQNPLFTGALGTFGGAVIHSTNSVQRAANGNSPSVQIARAVCLGQEALCRGLGEDIDWSEQITDYGFKRGIAVGAAWQDKVMNEQALVQIVTAAVDPSV